ncbi:BQ2448_4290 [Microbotryum intermedium]|uniref:Helicase SWR1 n=1 Tax=Microbotryum intermedium TaxID=269621 RepID=A0A238FL66_9BASI|nr:BQ2448_4290 [Microbotryum intermedium]
MPTRSRRSFGAADAVVATSASTGIASTSKAASPPPPPPPSSSTLSIEQNDASASRKSRRASHSGGAADHKPGVKQPSSSDQVVQLEATSAAPIPSTSTSATAATANVLTSNTPSFELSVPSISATASHKRRKSVAFSAASSSASTSQPAPIAPIAPTSGAPRTYTEDEIAAWRTTEIENKSNEVSSVHDEASERWNVELMRLMYFSRFISWATTQLAEIVNRHDDCVRELFHLDRFVTLVGFDPAVAKQDKSDVFLTFQYDYDLFTHATPEAEGSRRGRRATRRAANDAKASSIGVPVVENPVEDVAGPMPPPPTTTAATSSNSRRRSSIDNKGKGKAKEEVVEDDAAMLWQTELEEVPEEAAVGPVEEQMEESEPERELHLILNSTARREYLKLQAQNESKRSGRRSSASHDKGKGRAIHADMGQLDFEQEDIWENEPIVDNSIPASFWPQNRPLHFGDARLEIPPLHFSTLAELRQTSNFPLPRRSRPDKRPKYYHDEEGTVYTHHQQLPLPRPHDGSLDTMLSRFYFWTEDKILQPPPAEAEIDARAGHEAAILLEADRVRAENGVLHNPDLTKSAEAKRERDHQENLIDQAIYFSKLVHDERKAHIALAKKMGRMVLAHFDRLKNKGSIETKEETKNKKALARWTMREVRRKWKLAIDVIKARRKAALREEKERLGKEQLNKMLDKSTTMLHAQQVEMAGEEEDEEGESNSSAQETSDEDGCEEEEEEEDEESEVADEEEEEVEEEEEGEEGEEEGEEGEEGEEEGEEGTEAEDEEGTSALASDAASSESATPSPTIVRNSRLTNGRRNAPQRARSRLSVSVTPLDLQGDEADADESADADVFEGDDDDARDEEDANLMAEMEAEDEDDDDDSELGGLAEEADMPIEELLRRSGYAAMVQAEQEGTGDDEDNEAEAEAAVEVENAEGGAQDEDVSMKDDASVVTRDENAAPLTAEEVEAEAMSEFGSDKVDDEREDEDERLMRAMEEDEEDVGSDDSEMDGLAVDADLSIEELMRKYGYGNGNGHGEANGTDGPTREASSVAYTDERPQVNGHDHDAGETEEEEQSSDEAGEESLSNGQMQAETETEDGGADKEKIVLRPPFLLRGSLRPYQQAGLEWLASLYANGVNGILADEMGLGKTIQTISLLAHLACDRGQWGPHLVVVPTSVMLNWEMEFKKFLPGFKILTYYGNQKERKDKRKGWSTENSFHVCVTSYQLVLADQHVFRRKPWQYMILDEAHHIKNFRSQRWQTLLGFNARHRLLLTGTPLQNNLMELWSLLYFLMPHGLMQDGKGHFADHSDFQAWFSNPMEKAIENGEVMDEETKATVNKLHTVLRPYLLRRLKAEVETQMPGKTESIIYCRMSKRQRFLYDDFMSRSQTRETLGSGHFLSIINCLMQLRKVCNHPDLFETRPIVTSYQMRRSIANEYEPTELLVRKRLLAKEPIGKIEWATLTLISPLNETSMSTVAGSSLQRLDASPLIHSLHEPPVDFDPTAEPPRDTLTVAGWRRYYDWHQHTAAFARLDRLAAINSRRIKTAGPYIGADLIYVVSEVERKSTLYPTDYEGSDPRSSLQRSTILPHLIHSRLQRSEMLEKTIDMFAFVTPKVRVVDIERHALAGATQDDVEDFEWNALADVIQPAAGKLSIAFPDRSLLQYDCGKLQKLDELLRECKAGGHRVLIFTQMTKVLDILEEFLSFHGHRYLRLDGSTKIEQRQIITERFNSNDKILCFISSTRAGGLGINLQGADTVIFYDSDWNPALDRQCQDRAHRIGQTREVRIWRFVTEHSIEENMLKKANQKRRLDEMVISDGEFTTDYLQRLDWRDYLDENQLEELGVDANADPAQMGGPVQTEAEIRQALAAAEDVEDAAAARAAITELQVDQSDFSNEAVAAPTTVNHPSLESINGGRAEGSATPLGSGAESPALGVGPNGDVEMVAAVEYDQSVDPLAGTIDGYMVNFVERNFELFV